MLPAEKRAPMRFGKRSMDLDYFDTEKRAPMRFGKRMVPVLSQGQLSAIEDLEKRAPMRFGKERPQFYN